MAEALFRDLVKNRPDFEVGSAGVAAAPGMPASRHTAAILRERGLADPNFSSRMLGEEMLKSATHVFAMSEHHIAAIVDEFPDYADKVYLVSEFAAEDSLRGAGVSDPFGQDRAAYDKTRSDLEQMLPSLLAYIEQTWKEPSGDAS